MSRGFLAVVVGLAVACARPGATFRPFPDRPPAWHEHDDADVPMPRRRPTLLFTAAIEALFLRETLRVLGDGPPLAEDVNALDEVPCSTWYCPRHHLSPMTPAEVAAGPPAARPPRLPLRAVKKKPIGVTPGFVAEDADGRRYMVKLDPPGHPGLMSGSEIVCQRLMHAAGYYVPGAFPVAFGPGDLGWDPEVFTREELDAVLARGARLRDGRVRGVAVHWVEGKGLGGFDFAGTRRDDPNDRIPHEHRRSLRATRVLFAWLNVHDADISNTLDTWVEERGRRFVRHYFLDFGGGLGSSSTKPKSEASGKEGTFELGRTFRALGALGAYQRSWQEDRAARDAFVRRHPSIGWIEGDFDPDAFRTNLPVTAQTYMTPADAYWGAKLVASFADGHIAAAVAEAELPPADAAVLARVLARRRDVVTRRWLAAVTAVEAPEVSPDGRRLCWDDLAIRRGVVRAGAVAYAVEVRDLRGRALGRGTARPDGARACVALPGGGYRVVTVTAAIEGRPALPTHVHVGPSAWRKRVAVMGIERG